MLDALVLRHVTTRRRGSMSGREADCQTDDDARAVRAVLDGDLHTFRALYDRYFRLIHAVCCDFTHDRDLAQDLVHDVFLKSYQRLRQLRQPERFGAWLLTIARSVCRDWRRQRARSVDAEVGLDPRVSVARETAPDERLGALQRALSELPERERLAIHLAYLEQQPAELARRLLGLSRSGYYRVLDRARTRLERMLSDEEEVTR